MKRLLAAVLAAASAISAVALAAVPGPSEPAPLPARPLSAEEIVERSTVARGGLDAWRKLETVIWVGHLESERIPEPGLPFTLEEKRPNKSRFQVTTQTQPSVRVFDGIRGWKLLPTNDGMQDVTPYTALEDRFAREAPGLDGPLVDYRAKGRTVTLDGLERLEGHDCYRLAVRMPSGNRELVWVDAQSFLELRYDRPSYGRDGTPGTVSVYFRDYKTVGGLQMPSILEIGGGTRMKPDRMVIDRVALNPQIDDFRFERPSAPPRRPGVTISPTPPPPPQMAPTMQRPMPALAGPRSAADEQTPK